MFITAEQLQVLFLLLLSEFPDGVNADFLLSAIYHAKVADPIELSEVIEKADERGLVEFSDASKKCGLSERGRSILADARHLLADGVREEAIRAVLREYDALLGKSVFSCSVTVEENGCFLTCTEKIGDAAVGSLTLRFDDEKSARFAKHRFDKNPKGVWNTVRAVLTGDADFLL